MQKAIFANQLFWAQHSQHQNGFQQCQKQAIMAARLRWPFDLIALGSSGFEQQQKQGSQAEAEEGEQRTGQEQGTQPSLKIRERLYTKYN